MQLQACEALVCHILQPGIHCFPVDYPKSVGSGHPDVILYGSHGQNLVVAETSERDTLLALVFGIDTHDTAMKPYPEHTVLIT